MKETTLEIVRTPESSKLKSKPMLHKLPMYFKCFFSDKENVKVNFVYKIDGTNNRKFPYQLLKLSHTGVWKSLSIYPSVYDSVAVLLKELFIEELSAEMYQGKILVDPVEILEKINRGERVISIDDESNAEVFRLEYDISVDDLTNHK